MPMLQAGGGTARIFREMRGKSLPSSVLMAPKTGWISTSLECFARDRRISLFCFWRGERRDIHPNTDGRLRLKGTA